MKSSTLLIVVMSALTACTNPFGGKSLLNLSDVSLDWTHKDFDFGVQQIGSTSVKTFYIANDGNLDATDCGAVSLSDTVNFAIISQTCNSTTLSQGTQCEVMVESHPKSAGEKALTIDRTCRVKSNVVILKNPVRVTAVSPSAQWTPMTHSFGTIATNGFAFEKKFVLSNQGSSALTNCGLVTLSNTTDFGIMFSGNTCGLNDLAAGASCEVIVIGAPQSAGAKTTTLSRTCGSNFTFSTTLDQITVNAYDSFLSLYSPTINLGSVYEGDATTQYTYMVNEGADVPLSCTTASLTDSTFFSIVYDDCGTRGLTPGDGCSLGVRNSSSAPLGEHITNLTRSCTFPDASVKDVIIPVRVEIVPRKPVLYVFNDTHDYGNTFVGGVGSDNPFYFYNFGNADATGCGQPILDNTTDFSIVTNNCNGADLTINNWCDVTVRALPFSTGIKTAHLSMTCAVGGTITATLEQNGLPSAPHLVVSPSNFNYGTIGVGSNSDYDFDFSNQGPDTATGCGVPVLSNTIDFSMASDLCLTNDIAGNNGTCKVTVRAAPGSAGTKNTTLTRTCLNGGSVAANISVDGYVMAPNLSWGTLAYDFGAVNLGIDSSTSDFYLYNYGSAKATGCSSPSISNTDDFTITYDSCGTNDLNNGNSCYVRVRGNPLFAGLRTATLSRTCTVGGTIATTTDKIEVTGQVIASWGVQETVTEFGLIRSVGGVSNPQSIYYRNPFKVNLTGCSPPVLSNPDDFTIINDSCGSNDMGFLSACEMRVVANPKTTGVVSSTLSRTCAETGTINLNLTASGSAANAFPVQLGDAHSVILSDGTVKTWGNTPVDFSGINNAASFMLGESCVLLNDGKINCWGDNSLKQLGNGSTDGSSSTPVEVDGITNATAVFGNRESRFAVLNSGKVMAWGKNSKGLLGVGNTNDQATPAEVVGLPSNFRKIKFNQLHACAILNDNSLKCWGWNAYGQLGDGTRTDRSIPTLVSSLSGVVDVALGQDTTCAVLDTGRIYCWGANWGGAAYSTLGDGSNVYDRPTPGQVPSVTNAVSIAALNQATFYAVLSSGEVVGWGRNRIWEQNVNGFGNGTEGSPTPVSIMTGADPSVSIMEKYYGACAYKTDGDWYCWGGGMSHITEGLSGNMIPVKTTNLRGSVQRVGKEETCALFPDHRVNCWDGSYENLELGIRNSRNKNTIDQFEVTQLHGALKVASTRDQVCALKNDKNVSCWSTKGSNYLGSGQWENKNIAIQIPAINDAADVQLGLYNKCVLLNSGEVKCWGENYNGEVGNGNKLPQLNPTTVLGVSGATSLSVGSSGACANVSAGIMCWGYVAGSQFNTPTLIADTTTSVKVKTSQNLACSHENDNSLKCWGGSFGAFGTAGSSFSTDGNGSIEDFSVGTNVVCVLTDSKKVICKGYSIHGLLGGFSSLKNTQKIMVGNLSACALSNDGFVQCWGYGMLNSLGDITGNFGVDNYYHPSPTYRLNLSSVAELGQPSEDFYSAWCVIEASGAVKCTGLDFYKPSVVNGL